MSSRVSIIGGGPAGASAALSALASGAHVDIYEKSCFPRHKVCGEFLSPELAQQLARLGAWGECEALRPARLTTVHLSIGRSSKTWKLGVPAHGLSRFALDRILLESAVRGGAVLHRETRKTSPAPLVIANGRQSSAPLGDRLFGFKAHFQGPADDVMNLFFFDGCYVGVNAIESGWTNVCGLAREGYLREIAFDPDVLLKRSEALRARIAPLTRTMEWLTTGPLVYGLNPEAFHEPNVYLAGDAFGFVDPFTGSGMLGAVKTGISAGTAAAMRVLPARHAKTCLGVLRSQYRAAKFFRAAIQSGFAEWLLPFAPGAFLFRATRPRAN